MSCQHDALYRAICSHPDEDTPRLAYADLIEEEGDSSPNPSLGAGAARAAFIRTQIELARVHEYDPLHVSTRQLHPDMFTGWGMAHTLPKVPDGYSWEKFEFRRGFPWKLGVRSPEAFGSDGTTVFDAAPIQALEILEVYARNRLNIATLADWPHLTRIHRLEFSLGRFGAEAIAQLGNSPNATKLVELAFEFDGITAEGLGALTQSAIFPQLTALELRSNVIPPALIADALAAAREPGAMSHLSLKSNRIDHADAPHLFALPIMHGLQTLDLSDNPQLGVAGVQSLAESGALRGLRVLNLGKTRPGVPGIRDLVETNGLTGVRSLDLSANRLGPVAVKLVAESAAALGLRVINLANNHVRDAGATALANAKGLSGLLELNLEDAELTDAGALALAESPYLNELLRLNLTSHTRDRPFSDKTRRVLVERFGQRVSC
jgi:uncharacterized protein (TIGR02996 family)